MKSMPRTYIAADDVDGIPDIDLDFGTVTKRRVQGPPKVMDHSESDLRLHDWAGVAATVVILFMLVAVVLVAVS